MNLVESYHVTWADLIISVCAVFCGFLTVIHMPGTCVAHAYHMHYAKENMDTVVMMVQCITAPAYM